MEQNGLIPLRSSYPAAATLNHLRDLALGKGLTIFVTIDHSAAATEVGLALARATVLIFGSPRESAPNVVPRHYGK